MPIQGSMKATQNKQKRKQQINKYFSKMYLNVINIFLSINHHYKYKIIIIILIDIYLHYLIFVYILFSPIFFVEKLNK